MKNKKVDVFTHVSGKIKNIDLNRRFIGFEINPKYAKMINQRLKVT